jgi:prepilin-type N-terminal cleavage/methylation domain-containing protein
MTLPRMNIPVSPRRRAGRRAAFTLIEIMIVVMIIGLLAMIAVPNVKKYMENARYTAIQANLRQIDNAKSNWAMEHRKPDGVTPTEEDLAPYISGGKVVKVVGETYDPRPIGTPPQAIATMKLRNIEAGQPITIPTE